MSATSVRIREAVPVSTREKTSEGYLRATANITKVGVSFYPRSEFAPDDTSLPERIGLFRPRDIVASPETLRSIELKPVTLGHPATPVNTDNYRYYAKGQIGKARVLENDHVQVDMLITDPDLIRHIEAGHSEVSIGDYEVDVRKQEGTYNGERYHFIVTSPLDINHLAVVRHGDKGRAGETVRILDTDKGDEKVDQEKLTKDLTAAIREAVEGSKPDLKAGTLDVDKLGTAIINGVASLLEAQRKADREKAEKDAAEKAKETDKAKIEETVTERTAVLLDLKEITTPETFAKIKTVPLLDAMRTALKGTFKDAETMSEAECRGLLRGVMEQRSRDSAGGGKGAIRESAGGEPMGSWGGSAGRMSALDYRDMALRLPEVGGN